MSFTLHIPSVSPPQPSIELEIGQSIFVLGANGTGKSSLLQRFVANAGGQARRISAGRQTWFQSSAVEFTASQKQGYENQLRSWDQNHQSRWIEQNAQIRSSLTLYDLVDAENIDARKIAEAVRRGDMEAAQRFALKAAPLSKINELLALSNIPIVISVEGGDRLSASKNDSPQYGVAELSDGERNALLIAADILTIAPGTLVIVDEPERHLHRSIISPLLTQLLSYRNDCAFVVATHDITLPVDNPGSRTILIRSCSYSGQAAQSWEFDLIPADADIDDALKQDIIGARRRMVFIEGEETSLDKPIYNILFPNVSVRAKGSSREVEHAVNGLRSSEATHWVRAWGIIDNDGRDPISVAKLQAAGVYALPFYSVESIYYHPDVILSIAKRQAEVVGGDGEENTNRAIDEALKTVAPHFARLAARAVEKSIRSKIFTLLPTLETIRDKQPISVSIDTGTAVEAEISALNQAAASRDWTHVLSRCPIRETPALDVIARAIGLPDRRRYESAVLQMLRADMEALNNMRSYFGGLAKELEVI